jgi:hypothetical protein|tara:strand:+ start:3131 stop:3319 length:189 start_codon:yes stop_codon:yes gene_type:complete
MISAKINRLISLGATHREACQELNRRSQLVRGCNKKRIKINYPKKTLTQGYFKLDSYYGNDY